MKQQGVVGGVCDVNYEMLIEFWVWSCGVGKVGTGQLVGHLDGGHKDWLDDHCVGQ